MMTDNNINSNSAVITGTLVGLCTPKFVEKGVNKVLNKGAYNRFLKENALVSQPDRDLLEKGAENALKLSGLDKKGVHFQKVDEHTKLTKEEQALIDKIDRQKLSKRAKEAKKDKLVYKYAAINGRNASFNRLTDAVTYNPSKLPIPPFHELGHAQNKYNSKLCHSIQNIKYLDKRRAALASTILLLAPSKAELNPNSNTTEDKAIRFINNNAGIITSAMYAPTLFEEGMASYNGNKLAKQVLPKELYKVVKRNNAIAYMTYLSIALGIGLGTQVGVGVKNKIISTMNNK